MSDGDQTFEQALAELETIADSLERDDLALDEALALFERGIDRLRVAGSLLDSAHGKVEELVKGASETLTASPLDLEGGDTGEAGSD